MKGYALLTTSTYLSLVGYGPFQVHVLKQISFPDSLTTVTAVPQDWPDTKQTEFVDIKSSQTYILYLKRPVTL